MALSAVAKRRCPLRPAVCCGGMHGATYTARLSGAAGTAAASERCCVRMETRCPGTGPGRDGLPALCEA